MKPQAYFLILFLFPVLAQSQSYSNTVSVNAGIFGEGYGGEITYNTNLSQITFTQIGLDVSMATFNFEKTSVPYSSFTVSYSYFLTVYSRNRKMQSLSIGGGGIAGYELVNNGNGDISNIVSLDGNSKFIYGGMATIDLDIIVSEHISFVVKSSQFYHVNSDFGKFTNFSGVGLRYYFNL
ncbi:Conjugative transposon protein TraO [Pricia antarctica]|uniref:Conjugative transposon protein TraO n=1 Tax=Pricia antarctica TaxID=641691 RepID=A0A1G7B7M4_9FLAO|nr:conjugal transfer protein TraO [Pricia antarctica]SDE23023.1 Conjugative transposon protein TraO [Pricia antarctica]